MASEPGKRRETGKSRKIVWTKIFDLRTREDKWGQKIIIAMIGLNYSCLEQGICRDFILRTIAWGIILSWSWYFASFVGLLPFLFFPVSAWRDKRTHILVTTDAAAATAQDWMIVSSSDVGLCWSYIRLATFWRHWLLYRSPTYIMLYADWYD